MVPNPIYSGPIYDSVQPPLETITRGMLLDTSEHQGPSRSSSQENNPDDSFTPRYSETPLRGSQLQNPTLASLSDLTNNSTSSFPDSKSKFLDSACLPTGDNAIVITNSYGNIDDTTLSSQPDVFTTCNNLAFLSDEPYTVMSPLGTVNASLKEY